MSSKASDRLKEIRARAQSLNAPLPAELATESKDEQAEARAYFGALSLEQLIQGRTIQRIPIGHIAPNLASDMRQPRLLPLPEELVVQGRPADDYRGLVAELMSFGQSLKERQIQPVLVYAGVSPTYPNARYLLLVGHRRWTAAVLVGMTEIDAVVVESPTRADRVEIQYRENKDREEFSDMELVWALMQMKDALGDHGTWEDVEQRFGISRPRRLQLIRLASFTAPQQRTIARLRLQETQSRALHEAVRSGSLNERQVEQVLGRLAVIADERAAKDNANSPRIGIDAPTVARLVAQAQRASTRAEQLPSPKWLAPLRAQLVQTRRAVQRARGRAVALHALDAEDLVSEASVLLGDLHELILAVRQRIEPPEPPVVHDQTVSGDSTN